VASASALPSNAGHWCTAIGIPCFAVTWAWNRRSMKVASVMKTPLSRAIIAVMLIACFVLTPVAARAAITQTIIGTVTHVSTTDIDVKDQKTGKVMKFILIPRFKRVFSKDGKTTVQMSAVKPGTQVTLEYDRRALGVPHADRILINGSTRAVNG
jgi:hypothetical protein